MFCSHCGKQMDAEARFCSACGAASQPVMYGRAPFSSGQPLTRPRHPRVIAGVCAGFAMHYGWDLSLVRALAVLALFVSCGTVMLFYFAAWIIIPDAPYTLPQGGVGNTGVGI